MLTFRQRIEAFEPEKLEAICRVLADTGDGLTGSEIGQLLRQTEVADTSPDMTKWKRLYNAFAEFQNKHGVGNHVVVFIRKAMDPARYTDRPAVFDQRQQSLNKILAFKGMELGHDGKMRRVKAASTLDEALERANRMKEQLRKRDVHPDVLRSCTAEILADNYFHAVFEAVKSISAKIRQISGLTSDGAELVDQAFALGNPPNPLLAINDLDTPTLQGEQRGFINLLKGVYGVVRNPLAHEPKIEWNVTEQDALDILTMISLIHRKLDAAKQFRRPP